MLTHLPRYESTGIQDTMRIYEYKRGTVARIPYRVLEKLAALFDENP